MAKRKSDPKSVVRKGEAKLKTYMVDGRPVKATSAAAARAKRKPKAKSKRGKR